MTITASIDELAAAAADGAVVVDVREPGEYVGGHVPGALLMPMGQLPSRVAELDRQRPVYVICASGNRSRAMSDFLSRAGFDARSVDGGTTAWAGSGRPVAAGSLRSPDRRPRDAGSHPTTHPPPFSDERILDGHHRPDRHAHPR